MDITQIPAWRENCCGCAACVNVCPVGAIAMTLSDRDGFYYPHIDRDKCVNCGLCGQLCSRMADKKPQVWGPALSAAAKQAHIRASGSSGGLFYLFARKTLDRGGVVFGAAYDPESKSVHHRSTEEVPLERLLRSKYAQSRIGFAYQQVEDFLKQDREVLFSGTPCQVRGLLEYLQQKKVSGRLTTLDFMCHGVPSPELFRQTLQCLENAEGSKITEVTFREKTRGWRKQRTRVYFENGQVWERESLKTPYYYFFLHNDSLRDSCYGCEEYASHRSDLTMADYWLLPKEQDDDLGTSLLLVHTGQGQRLVEAVAEDARITPEEETFTGQQIYSHKGYNRRRKRVWSFVYRHGGTAALNNLYFPLVRCMDTALRTVRRVGGAVKRRLMR